MKTIRRGEFDFVVVLRTSKRTHIERLRATTPEYLAIIGAIEKAIKAGRLIEGDVIAWETMTVRRPAFAQSWRGDMWEDVALDQSRMVGRLTVVIEELLREVKLPASKRRQAVIERAELLLAECLRGPRQLDK